MILIENWSDLSWREEWLKMIAFLNESYWKLIRSELERRVAHNDSFPYWFLLKIEHIWAGEKNGSKWFVVRWKWNSMDNAHGGLNEQKECNCNETHWFMLAPGSGGEPHCLNGLLNGCGDIILNVMVFHLNFNAWQHPSVHWLVLAKGSSKRLTRVNCRFSCIVSRGPALILAWPFKIKWMLIWFANWYSNWPHVTLSFWPFSPSLLIDFVNGNLTRNGLWSSQNSSDKGSMFFSIGILIEMSSGESIAPEARNQCFSQ